MMSIEAKSFRNMVEFYADELKEILKGTNPSTVFSTATTRRTLRQWGVLEFPDGRTRGGYSRVSQAAQDLLEGEEPAPKHAQSEYMLKRWQDPEFREKALRGLRERAQNREVRLKNSIRMIELWRDPVYKEKMTNRKTRGRRTARAPEKPASYSLYWPLLPYSWLLTGEGHFNDLTPLSIALL